MNNKIKKTIAKYKIFVYIENGYGFMEEILCK